MILKPIMNANRRWYNSSSKPRPPNNDYTFLLAAGIVGMYIHYKDKYNL